jgi:hypothetical protein
MDEAERYSALIGARLEAWQVENGGAEPDEATAREIRREVFGELRRTAARPRAPAPILEPRLVGLALAVAVVAGAVIALWLRAPRQPQPVLVRSGAGQTTVGLPATCPDGHPDVTYRYSFLVRPASAYAGTTAIIKVHGAGGGWTGYDREFRAKVAGDGSFAMTLPAGCRTGGQVEVSPVSVGGRTPSSTPG